MSRSGCLKPNQTEKSRLLGATLLLLASTSGNRSLGCSKRSQHHSQHPVVLSLYLSLFCYMPLLFEGCFDVATQHRENVETSASMQRRYEHVVTHVATPKDGMNTGKTSTNNRAGKVTPVDTEKHIENQSLAFP